MEKDLEGKVFLVTGATEGIGKAAALNFAQRGAVVAIVGRNRDKGEKVLAELKAQSGNEHVELYLADMSRMSDIRTLANEFKAKHPKLDVLVNNAGAVFTKYQISADNLEMTFALNHVGYFLLTVLLLDELKKTPGARIVSTSSGAHQGGTVDVQTISTRPKRDAGFAAYCDSKLANILFTRELAKKLAGTSVTANCFHPGFVSTGFGHNNGGILSGALKVVGPLFARTPEKGAETLIWLATSPDAARYNGEYFHDRKVASTNRKAKDDTVAAQLWAFSEKLTAGVRG